MLMMPVSAPSLTTGTCRIRCSVITCISSFTVACPSHVCTSAVMIESTDASSTAASSWSRRTTSRSETMPSTLEPSRLTIRAPTLCCESRATSSRTVAPGGTVTTSWLGLAARTSLIRISNLPRVPLEQLREG